MSDTLTIGVAIITRNRIEQLRRLCPQLTKMDQVVVVDTGSQDGTEKYIRGLGKPFEYHKFAWRDYPTDKNSEFGFCAARNESFRYLRTTHALWLDTDDTIGVVKGNKETFASADQSYGVFKRIASEAPDVDVWFIQYVYSRDENGNPNVVHTRERMVKLSLGWTWVYPIHECLVPNNVPKHAEVHDLDIIHMPTRVVDDSSKRNLRFLNTWLQQLEAQGNHHDLARCRMNLAETLYALGEYEDCVKVMVGQFIKKHSDALDIERWHGWCYVAKAQIELKNFEAARAAALAAIDIEPGLCDGYLLLAQVKLIMKEDPQDILLLLDAAGRAEEPPSQIITNPLDYSFTPRCIMSDCKFQLGQFTAALEWANKALSLAPNDPRAEFLRMQAASEVRKRDAVEASKALYLLYADYEENEKAAKIYDVLPYVAQQNQDIIELAKGAYNKVRHLFDRKEYVKLYQSNSRWLPIEEKFIVENNPPGKDRYQWTLDRLKKALPAGGRILDVGCSDGFHSLLYAKEGFEVVGVDLDPRCVALANERAAKWNLSAKFIHGFFEELPPDRMPDPFDNSRTWWHNFDAVVCGEVIEHVQDPAYLIGCLVDCAKDKAPVLITTPDEAFDKGDVPDGAGMNDDVQGMSGHVRAFTQETFETLLKSDSEYNVVESHYLEYSWHYRESQGWQVGEIRREPRPEGPIIRIWCGDIVKFTPDYVNRGGIGGSETAVVHMAEAWAKMGCQVVVYSGINGIWNGVFYRTADRFKLDHKSDVFISWRLPLMFKDGRPNATTTIMWMHDLFAQMRVPGYKTNEIPQPWVDNIDYVMALSKFHKKVLENAHPNLKDKIIVTRNGVDPLRYVGKDIKKVSHKYFYSSSYDRGLKELLDVWPQIKNAIPDAELHVCYGLQTSEQIYTMTKEYDKLNDLYKLVGKMQALPGVTHHERLGQQELADLQLSCEAWLYPVQPNHESGEKGFLETYCVTAQEAQAARCKIISRKNGALGETIKNAIWWTEEIDIVEVLKNIDNYWNPEWTEQNFQFAIHRTWDGLAVEWAQLVKPREVVVV